MTEIKVTLSAVGALVASMLVAVLNAAVANNAILGSLPSWLQFIIITVAPALITFLSGYATRSTTSSVSNGFVPQVNRN